MEGSLFKNSINRLKNNASSFIAVGILCGLFLILLALLSLIDSLIFLVAIPFLLFPIVFACQIACYYAKAGQPITLTSLFQYFFGFFRPQFRSSFKGIRAYLTALLFYVIGLLVSYLSLYFIFRGIYGDVFPKAISNLVAQYSSGTLTYEDLMAILRENNDLLLTFILCAEAVPLPAFICRFIYSMSFASISVYYRNNIINGTGSLINLAVNNTYAKNRSQMRRDWFILNWPLLVLSLLGSIGGAALAIFVFKDVTLLSALVILGSVALLLFFLPFYFSNMETLFERYEGSFKEGHKQAIEMILARIQASIDLTEEEKKGLEESFRNSQDE